MTASSRSHLLKYMVGELMEEKRTIDALALKATLLCPLTAFFLPMWVAVSSEGIDEEPHGVIQSKVLGGEHNLLGEGVAASGTLTRVLLYAQVNQVKWPRGGMLTFHHDAMQKPQKVCPQGKIYGSRKKSEQLWYGCEYDCLFFLLTRLTSSISAHPPFPPRR